MRVTKNGMYATVPADIGAILVAHKGWNADNSVPAVTLPGPGGSGGGGTMTAEELDALIRAIVDAENAPLKDDLAKKADKTALSTTNLNVQSATDKANTLQSNLNASLARITTLEGKAYTVADTAWTACTMAAGITDKLWVRVWKGRVIFKAAASATGTASSLSTGRLTSQSSFKQIATLPGGLPKPNGNQDWYCPVTTYQQGQSVPYGTTLMYLSGSSGNMYVVAGNVAMDGIFPDSAAGYPVGAMT